MALGTINLGDLQGAIARAGAGWQAGATSVSQLSDDQKILRLGAVPPAGTASLEEREQQAAAKAQAGAGIGAGIGAVGAPASFDWRNSGGQNYITPIEDQGGCGSCVAFGTIAAIEGTARVYRGNANLAVDLSEAQLFYCYAPSQGYGCSTGWWPNNAFDFAKNSGLDAEMWLAEGIADTGWIRGAHIAGLWTIDQDRNAWVYVAAVGWRKLSPDNDNILLDMLSQLAAAKASKRTVDFYQEQGVIKQIYVY